MQGHPYMESLVQNKSLLYSLICSAAVILGLACGLLPELAAQFEIVDFPSDVSRRYLRPIVHIHFSHSDITISFYSSENS